MSSLRIGAAQVDFTPEAGLPLMGNFGDDCAATGVHDPLFCRALVFKNSAGTRGCPWSHSICACCRVTRWC